MAVVEAGMVSLADLKNGAVDLCDVALCSDFLAARADNEWLIRPRPEDK